jgi:hypothetical protein
MWYGMLWFGVMWYGMFVVILYGYAHSFSYLQRYF